MISIFTALAWRIHGTYDFESPSPKNTIEHRHNMAKWEVWKYNTFGDGNWLFTKDKAYDFIDSGELSGKPLYINDPITIAAMASILSELRNHEFVDLIYPRSEPFSKEELSDPTTLEKIVRLRTNIRKGVHKSIIQAVAKNYHITETDSLSDMLRTYQEFKGEDRDTLRRY